MVTQSEYCFPTPSLGSHNARKYATKTLTKLDWNNSELINGDVPEGIKRIKKQDGPEIQIHENTADLIPDVMFWLRILY